MTVHLGTVAQLRAGSAGTVLWAGTLAGFWERWQEYYPTWRDFRAGVLDPLTRSGSISVGAPSGGLTLAVRNWTPTKPRKPRAVPSYRAAVAWIAGNDETAECDPHALAALISVLLVADLWGREPLDVAKAVAKLRERGAVR